VRAYAALAIPAGATLVANGRQFDGAQPIELSAAEADDRLSFVLSRAPIESASVRAERRSARIYTVPSGDLAQRISPNAEAADVLRDTLLPILNASHEDREQVVVRLPLRWYPTASAAGMVGWMPR